MAYIHAYWFSEEDNSTRIDYFNINFLPAKCNECETQVSFWLGAPQEPIEIPYYQHTGDSFYYQYLKVIDYYGYQIREAYLLPQIDNAPEYDIYTCAPQIRSLSFWLGQEVEELAAIGNRVLGILEE